MFPHAGHLTSSDTSLSAFPVSCLFRVLEWVCFFFGTARRMDSQMLPSRDGIRSGSNERMAIGDEGRARLGSSWRALLLGCVRRKGRGRMNLGRLDRQALKIDGCRVAILMNESSIEILAMLIQAAEMILKQAPLITVKAVRQLPISSKVLDARLFLALFQKETGVPGPLFPPSRPPESF